VNDIQQVGGDGVEDPRNNHTVHARPRLDQWGERCH
jgi:hypothetical protein